ncbi:MAG: hypothetical protein ACXWG1_05635 [Usitatibacter sp.]
MDELRDHDPNPNARERAWMGADPFGTAVRVLALAVLAVGIGVTVSQIGAVRAPTVVAAHGR